MVCNSNSYSTNTFWASKHLGAIQGADVVEPEEVAHQQPKCERPQRSWLAPEAAVETSQIWVKHLVRRALPVKRPAVMLRVSLRAATQWAASAGAAEACGAGALAN